MAEASDGKTIKVTLVKSLIGTKHEHRATVRGPGPAPASITRWN